MTRPVVLRLYLALTALLPGLLRRAATRAHTDQGADPARLTERMGTPGAKRPDGALIWIHAASVGELTSVLPLARDIIDECGAQILFTTTTTTGAETAARRMPKGALHQFQPIDTPRAVAAFLDHWQPDLALFVEGDVWPRMALTCTARRIPMALLNARASRSRARMPRVARALLSQMAVITVQSPDTAQELKNLGLDPAHIHTPGNLKADLPAPPLDMDALTALRSALGEHPTWAAVSTHEGEDDLILLAHAHARRAHDAILILVPRHPERGDAIAAHLDEQAIPFARRSSGALPGPHDQVYLADTLGETGLVYAIARMVFVGGSLKPGIGGHTPYEPAAMGCAVVHGPYVGNFEDAYRDMTTAGAALMVEDAEDLGNAATALLGGARLDQMQTAARRFTTAQSGARARTLDLLAPYLPRDNRASAP